LITSLNLYGIANSGNSLASYTTTWRTECPHNYVIPI